MVNFRIAGRYYRRTQNGKMTKDFKNFGFEPMPVSTFTVRKNLGNVFFRSKPWCLKS